MGSNTSASVKDCEGVDVVHKILLQAAVDAVQPKVGDFGRQPAMNESGAINHGNHILLEQPFAINAVGAECLTQREIAFREQAVEALLVQAAWTGTTLPRAEPAITLRSVFRRQRMLRIRIC